MCRILRKLWPTVRLELCEMNGRNIRKRVFAYMIVCFITAISAGYGYIFALAELNNNSNVTDSGIIEFIVLLIIMIVLLKNLKL